MRDRPLKRIHAVIERQQRMLAKRDDDGFVLGRRDVDFGSLEPVDRSAVALRFFHLATVFWLMP